MNTGNLYLLQGSRPPPRAFAQIPYRCIPWPLNNDVAGRGAMRRLLDRDFATSRCYSAQRTSTYKPWNGPRGLPVHLLGTFGPMVIPPINQHTQPLRPPHLERTAGSVDLPLAGREVLPPARSSEDVPAAAQDGHIAPAVGPAEDTPATILADHVVPTIPSGAEISTDQAGGAMPAEQERSGELDRIQSKLALWDAEERQAHARPRLPVGVPAFKPSDQIHVMGLDLAGRYIAHALAGCETIPPVRYLIHRHFLYKQWHQADKQLTLYRGATSIARRRVKAELIPEDPADSRSNRVIDNLLVTLPAAEVLQALGHIRHRLDHRSTICLVNDGLGVAEALIEAYFPDESRRPIFLLGHFTTSLGHGESRFSVAEIRPGRLYLSLFSPPKEASRFNIKRHPPIERTARATHFIRLLTAMPGLNATGHPMPDFLRYKLPSMAFRTIVDPLAALLDCRYSELTSNPYARQLMDRLIGELSRLVSRLPECRQSKRLKQFAVSSALRDEVFHKLMLRRTADSKLRVQIGRGWDTDINYLSGYFVRRGREVQASVTALDSIMWAVKAKQVVTLGKLEGDIPFETEDSA